VTATIGFPSSAFTDASGNLTAAARFFLQGLFEKLGGSAGVGTDAAAVSAALTAEIAARTASDATLTAEITAEATARANGDIVEAQLRTAADATGAAQTAAVGSSLIGVTGSITTEIATIVASIEWNAGSVTVADPNFFATTAGTVTTGTLTPKAGPTINATTSAPFSIFDGVAASPALIGPTEFQIVGTAAGGARSIIDAYASVPRAALRRTNGTPGSPTAIAANNPLGSFEFFGYDGTAWPTASAASIQGNAINAWTTADHSGFLSFLAVNSGTTVATEKMRLINGQLLVGTTAAVASEKIRVSGQSLADFMMVTPSAGLTAHAGGTQAAALALTAGVNYITTCATAGDSVRLPTSVAGLTVEVINAGAASCQVYGAGTDTINNVATATGVPVAAGKTGYYRCAVAGKWFGGTLT